VEGGRKGKEGAKGKGKDERTGSCLMGPDLVHSFMPMLRCISSKPSELVMSTMARSLTSSFSDTNQNLREMMSNEYRSRNKEEIAENV